MPNNTEIIDLIKDENFKVEDLLNGNIDNGQDMLSQLGLAQFISLPDDQFEALSEGFLIEFERAFYSNEFKLVLSQAMREGNFNTAQAEQVFDEAQEVLKRNDTGISAAKRDFLSRFFAIFLNAVMEAEDIAKRIIKIPTQLSKGARLPEYAKTGDAGMDIYALEDITIAPGETKIIPTGIRMAIPQGYAILIQPRSGLSVQSKLRVANTPGLIDSGYRDEIGVIVENIEPRIKDIEVDWEKSDPGAINVKSIEYGKDYTITQGQRFAQMRLVEAPAAALFRVDDISEVPGFNRNSGFGGTGNF